jgi:hypothetical protein
MRASRLPFMMGGEYLEGIQHFSKILHLWIPACLWAASGYLVSPQGQLYDTCYSQRQGFGWLEEHNWFGGLQSDL